MLIFYVLIYILNLFWNEMARRINLGTLEMKKLASSTMEGRVDYMRFILLSKF